MSRSRSIAGEMIKRHYRSRKVAPRFPDGRQDHSLPDSRGWSTSRLQPLPTFQGMPRRHGVMWNEVETDYLRRAFEWGASIGEIAEDHERTGSGIFSKLLNMGLVSND